MKERREIQRMKTKIIMNRHVIQANKKHGRNDPPIAVKTYKSTIYAHEVEVVGTVRLIYDPDNADCSGATAWMETNDQVVVVR